MSVSSFKSLAKGFVDNTFSDFTQTYTFQSLNKAPDGQGGFTSGWSTFATVTGFVKIDSGREGELDDHIKSEYSRKFSFEFVAGLQNNMRILYNGDYYNIRSINSVQDSTIWIDVMGDKDIAS
jgi:SPP1 family predicted phage head-tail adaptor|tara:strand:+ start:378 stop:746 length:369 start_codon:yes stop_codon:yes gene_type:complete